VTVTISLSVVTFRTDINGRHFHNFDSLFTLQSGKLLVDSLLFSIEKFEIKFLATYLISERTATVVHDIVLCNNF